MLCKGVGVPVCVCVGVCVICVHAYVAFKMLLVNPLSNYVTMLRIQSSSSGSLNEWMGINERTNATERTGPDHMFVVQTEMTNLVCLGRCWYLELQ